MRIIEELKREENKKKYKELAKKFHPDKSGNIEMMKELNKYKDLGDEEFSNKYIKEKEDLIEKYDDLREWIKQLKIELPIIFAIVRRGKDSIIINIHTYQKEFNIFNAEKIKNKNELKKIILEKNK